MIKSDIDASWITGFLSAFEELNSFSPIQNYFEFKPLGPEPIDELLEHLREQRNAQLEDHKRGRSSYFLGSASTS